MSSNQWTDTRAEGCEAFCASVTEAKAAAVAAIIDAGPTLWHCYGQCTDVAIESAGNTLVKGDRMGIAKAIHLSQAIVRK